LKIYVTIENPSSDAVILSEGARAEGPRDGLPRLSGVKTLRPPA